MTTTVVVVVVVMMMMMLVLVLTALVAVNGGGENRWDRSGSCFGGGVSVVVVVGLGMGVALGLVVVVVVDVHVGNVVAAAVVCYVVDQVFDFCLYFVPVYFVFYVLPIHRAPYTTAPSRPRPLTTFLWSRSCPPSFYSYLPFVLSACGAFFYLPAVPAHPDTHADSKVRPLGVQEQGVRSHVESALG